jgi:uncharacterized protein YqfA (UPF0365 family)
MSPLDGIAVAQSPGWYGWWIVAGIAGVIALVILLVIAQFFRLWLQAYMSNAGVTMTDLIGMYLRKVEMTTVVFAKIQLVKSGIHDTTVNDLESHYLAGGRVGHVTRAMIAASRAVLALDWNKACAIDLAGRDITDAINTSVNPKVIDVPDPGWGRQSIDAVAMDGIQLKAKVRVTVRTNLMQLIGGATEQTIMARVGEGIVSSIGSSQTYKAVLENPNRISKAVLGKGLDSGTAYEILSIDIADLDVGANIGAQLQVDQPEADTRRFQAEAEKRRAMAIAQTAENRAKVEENRAMVILAEAEVPKAMAGAFRSGNLGMMDG